MVDIFFNCNQEEKGLFFSKYYDKINRTFPESKVIKRHGSKIPRKEKNGKEK